MTDWSRSNRIDERDEAGRRIANFGADDLAVPANLTGRLRYLDLRGEGRRCGGRAARRFTWPRWAA